MSAEDKLEDIKGRAKEAAGAVTSSESLKDEGQAQQKKADAERRAEDRQKEADSAKESADAYEAEERSHQ